MAIKASEDTRGKVESINPAQRPRKRHARLTQQRTGPVCSGTAAANGPMIFNVTLFPSVIVNLTLVFFCKLMFVNPCTIQ